MAATGIPGSRRHAVAQPQLEVDGDRATGRWTVLDFRTEPGLAQPVRIVAVARDEYHRVDGTWLIARSALDVQWVEP